MKNIRVFLSQIFQFLEVKFSLYLNRRVFVMAAQNKIELKQPFFPHITSKSTFLQEFSLGF